MHQTALHVYVSVAVKGHHATGWLLKSLISMLHALQLQCIM